jgi:hypothetical protein
MPRLGPLNKQMAYKAAPLCATCAAAHCAASTDMRANKAFDRSHFNYNGAQVTGVEKREEAARGGARSR